MTMIRINLIAERKAGAPKTPKKAAKKSSELEENIILIVAIVIALLGGFFWHRHYKNKLQDLKNEQRKLQAEYDKVKIWIEKREEFEIQKELLNEKIQKISSLKDRREGPVKLMEDVHNVLPESVWLSSINQGFDRNLTQATGAGRSSFAPSKGRSLPSSLDVKVSGFAKNTDAITNFAKKIQSLDRRYANLDLNQFEKFQKEEEGSGYSFDLYFKIKPVSSGGDTAGEQSGGGAP
ncbi:PilN domain-containing protein [Sulfidibacter corallicola]|uniref:PilN domain-containing protein n=1 Tax=Sulfidibacter corallicola TaxID=2818388 RepID=A0A8A4TST7_SULCO|nr:PilN domain-containing protein [Sulfidibacter corallicola]QTD53019.1 PilN domain-containing protein [Sulfidibacter corallicola]